MSWIPQRTAFHNVAYQDVPPEGPRVTRGVHLASTNWYWGWLIPGLGSDQVRLGRKRQREAPGSLMRIVRSDKHLRYSASSVMPEPLGGVGKDC